jgi:phosphopentomutase
LAAEHHEGTTFVNAGNVPLDDGSKDSELQELNLKQSLEGPIWGGARGDKYTFQQAMRYLKKYQPRFMFLSLDDADEWGHRNNYPEYIKTLHQYDDWIESLLTTLEDLGEYGQSTTLLITTDHGRGDGSKWSDHGISAPESKNIWLYAGGPRVKSTFALTQKYTHNDIRPTIQALMNISTTECRQCGRVISEILSNTP